MNWNEIKKDKKRHFVPGRNTSRDKRCLPGHVPGRPFSPGSYYGPRLKVLFFFFFYFISIHDSNWFQSFRIRFRIRFYAANDICIRALFLIRSMYVIDIIASKLINVRCKWYKPINIRCNWRKCTQKRMNICHITSSEHKYSNYKYWTHGTQITNP